MLSKEQQALSEKNDRVELMEKLQKILKEAEDAGLHPMDVIGVAEYVVKQYEHFHFGTCFYQTMEETKGKGKI